MRYLIDTHILIWSLTQSKRIPRKIFSLLETAPEIHVSGVSFWEISLKFGLGKLDISGISPEALPDTTLSMGFQIALPEINTMASIHRLPLHKHRDPFDRMLVWQAICEDYTLLTADAAMSEYKKSGLRFVV